MTNDAALDLSRRDLLIGSAAAIAISPSVAWGTAPRPTLGPAARRSFTPGEIWLDTAGKPIQAHGASIIHVGGAFYWYGENKEFTTGKGEIHSWGVRCYRSADLYNWDDLGTIIPPDQNDRNSPLHPTAFLDRPHIIYNPRTKKFVCWIKMLSEPFQTRAVLTADSITGPYTLVKRDVRPLAMSAGDYDIVASPDDGKAYMYFERVHSEMICADLTDDYSDFTGYYSTHMPRPGPPSVREGTSYFRRGNKHYLATSGTTAYYPNPSEIAVADTFHGPFTTLGDLHAGDRSLTSFNSQISSVFKHPGKKDLYIALADRWMGPQSGAAFESGETSRTMQRAFTHRFARPPQPMSPPEQDLMTRLGGLAINTSQARYVWLPIRFDGERPVIEWRPEWRVEDYD